MQHIIVLGAGYAGLRAVEKLAKNIEFKITLIDTNRYHYLQTETYQFLSGRLNMCDITYDLNSFCSAFKNVKFIHDEAINIKNNNLICKNREISFNTLIIATAAEDFIPNAFKHTLMLLKI